MRPLIALCCVIAVLSLVLTWELATPEDNPLSVDAAEPTGPSRAAVGGTDKSSPREFDVAVLADIAASTTERPLFSPTRRPSSRTVNAAGTTARRDEVPRLTGVIVGPSGGWAIFAGADGKSHAAAAGDAIGAFKVRAIGPGVVTLTGSEGDRVLRPTYVTPPGVASSDAQSPDSTPPIANKGMRTREGAR